MIFANATSIVTTFEMPASNVTVEALFEQIPIFTVTVLDGTGGGDFEAGETVKISTEVPAGYRFIGWESTPAVIFADATSDSTTFEMPASDITVAAIFELISTYEVTVIGGTGGGEFEAGSIVKISAEVPIGYRFVSWESEDAVIFTNEKSVVTTFEMPASDVTVEAIFEPISTYEVTVIGGTGDGEFAAGEAVKVSADVLTGYRFVSWESSPAVIFTCATSTSTTFEMPAADVTVTAIFEPVYTPISTYEVKVVGGTGGGVFEVDATVQINAIVPPGSRFVRWESDPVVGLENAASINTTFQMPATNVTVTAIFEPITDMTNPPRPTTTRPAPPSILQPTPPAPPMSPQTPPVPKPVTPTTPTSPMTPSTPTEARPKLPQTGVASVSLFLSGLALLVSGLGIAFKKKKDK